MRRLRAVAAVDRGTPTKVNAVWRGAIACSRGPRQSDGIGRSRRLDQEPGPMGRGHEMDHAVPTPSYIIAVMGTTISTQNGYDRN